MVKYTDKTVNVGPGDIHYQVSGGSPAHTLVSIHSLGTNSSVFKYFGEYMARRRGFGSLTIDNPGHGASFLSHDKAHYSLDAHVQGVERVLNAESLGKVVLVGQGTGSLIAQRFAAQHPRKVKALVLVSPLQRGKNSGVKYPGAKSLYNWIAGKVTEDRPDAYFPDFSDPGNYNGFRNYALQSQSRVKALITALRAMRGWDVRGDVPKINTPTLLVNGHESVDKAQKLYDLFLKNPSNKCKGPIYIEYPDYEVPLITTRLNTPMRNSLGSVVEDYLVKDLDYKPAKKPAAGKKAAPAGAKPAAGPKWTPKGAAPKKPAAPKAAHKGATGATATRKKKRAARKTVKKRYPRKKK
jgi:pimeloyl-ACP methyl ester carboxylesterase